MAGRRDIEDSGVESDGAVERSLEDFIARANSTLPVPTVGSDVTGRRQESPKRGPREALPSGGRSEAESPKQARLPGSTLVVLGSQAPLADVTEIVSRVPAAEAPAPPRPAAGLRIAAAFLAGAAVVLLASRFLAGTPPARPPTIIPAPIVTPVPIVKPMPVIEPIPAPEPAAVVEEAAVVKEVPPAAERRAKPATPRPAKPKPAPSRAQGSGTLVDPFAN